MLDEMHTYIKNNKLMLTEKQISVLKSYQIDYTQDVKMLLYQIDEILNSNYDETLDELSLYISEMDYYNNTNK